MITMSLENDLVKVTNPSVYAYDFRLNQRGGTQEVSKTFSPEEDGDFGAAVSIFQGFYCFSKAAKEFDYKDKLTKIHVTYPANLFPMMTYLFGLRNIMIPHYIPKEGYPSAYMSWDSMGHEYAHFVSTRYGFFPITLSAHIHYSNVNELDTIIEHYGGSYRRAKRIAPLTTYRESWATVYSILIQQYFDDEWKSIAIVGDDTYTNSTGTNEVLSSYHDLSPRRQGDCEERAVDRIMYMIADPETNEYDKFGIGFEEFWRISYTYKSRTFSSFASALYDEGYSKSDLGLLFGQFNVAPDEIFITNNYLDTCPTLTWSAYMGSAYFNYNYFEMHFLDDNGKELITKKIKSRGEETCYYTLREDDWKTILDNCTETFYVNMQVWQTDYRDTGGYYTETFEFNLPTTNAN